MNHSRRDDLFTAYSWGLPCLHILCKTESIVVNSKRDFWQRRSNAMTEKDDIFTRLPHDCADTTIGSRSSDSVLFYQGLRQDNNLIAPEEATEGFGITEIEIENGQRIRLMHIVQILPVVDSSFFLYLDAPGFLAMKHFNERSNLVVPDLETKLEGCNLFLTMEMLNSQISPITASSKFYSLFLRDTTFQSPQPAAVVGAYASSVSSPLAVLAGAYGVPLISPSSTSSQLEETASAPTFGRTIATNTGMAEATALYFKDMGVTYLGVLFVRDGYGTSFQKDLADAAARHGIKLHKMPYEENDIKSIQSALRQLKSCHARYIYAILPNGSFQNVLEEAYDAGLVGNDYAWYLPEIGVITEKGYSLDRRKQAKLVEAIHGAQTFGVRSRKDPAFEGALGSLQTDAEFQSNFLAAHPESQSYQGVDLSMKTPVISPFSYTAYDAVMALGIAACQADEYMPTSTDLFEQFKKTAFDGASGLVAFDLETGTRKFETLEYAFTNVFIDEALSDDDMVVFQSRTSTVVDFNANTIINEINPVIYNDGTSIRPIALPSVEEDLNLVPIGVFIVGWTMAGVIILTCLALVVWVIVNRNKKALCAAQPTFLYMLLAGTLLMASSIVPMTFQEPASQEGLNFACMATPWLFVLGFSTAFSAIFTKCSRISILVQRAMDLTRATVTPCDVLKPFLILTFTNITLLTAWTLKSPLVWTRISVDNFDTFGRIVETYGVCRARQADGETDLFIAFASSLVTLNFLVVVFTFYKASQTRQMPNQYSEMFYVSLCIAFMVEGFLLGVPILFLSGGDPTAYFLVRSMLVAVFCTAILGPIFAPKVWIQHQSVIQEASAVQEWSTFLSEMQSNQRNAQLRKQEKSRRSSFCSSRNGGGSQNGSVGATSLSSQNMRPAGIEQQEGSSDAFSSIIHRERPPSSGFYPSTVAQLRANILLKNGEERKQPIGSFS